MRHSPIVLKFGGSSVASIERLRMVAEKLAERAQSGAPLVVVVSAMGKQTSELLELAERASQASGSGILPRRELDMLVSTGERISMALLSIILNGLGRSAVSFTGSQSGIITDTTHFNARVLDVRPRRILEALDSGSIAVVAGYQGMSEAGEITTLGRGGSDTSAVALASALGAPACEIFSDVDGIYTGDPHQLPGALHLGRVGYSFVWEMAHAGARVLNREAIRLARQSQLPIYARASFPKAGAERQTLVTEDGLGVNARAVVQHPDVLEVVAAPQAFVALVEVATTTGFELRDPELSSTRCRAWIPRCPLAERALCHVDPALVRVRSGLSLVSLVSSTPEVEGAPRESLSEHGTLVHASQHRSSALVAAERAHELVNELHRSFVEQEGLRQSA